MWRDRRDFLQQLALLSATLAGGTLVGGSLGCRQRRDGATRRSATFTDRRRQVLEAVCARILPTDHEPGAREAGCAEFIDRQLGLPHFSLLKTHSERGLDLLDRLARRQAQTGFVELEAPRQDEILRALQRERRRRFSGPHVFALWVTLTLEGFLSDPRHGGNRGKVGWAFAGYHDCWFHGGGVGRERRG